MSDFTSIIYPTVYDFVEKVYKKSRYARTVFHNDNEITLIRSLGRPYVCNYDSDDQNPMPQDAFVQDGEQFYIWNTPVISTAELPEELADVKELKVVYSADTQTIDVVDIENGMQQYTIYCTL
jgi:hypothetical protein